jgi:rhamnosyltransferase subunit B
MGSAGDVHPFVWLGKLLQARGHEVVVLAQEAVRFMPENAGLPTVAYGNRSVQEDVIRNPDLWHPRKAIEVITRMIPICAQEAVPVIRRHILDETGAPAGNTVMIAGALAFAARVLAERHGVPLLTAHLQPCIFMSADDSPVMLAHAEWLPKMPRFLRQAFFDLANWRVDGLLGPGIEGLRRDQGLTPARVKGVMRSYWHSPDGVLCLFPEFYGRRAGDWPAQAVLTRFPLYDESAERPTDETLERFLAAGTAPVVITPGSANAHANRFIQQAAGACRMMGRRALVVTRYPEQVGPLPGDSAAFEYIPFGRVFPRAAAIVHHGGIGTTAQCLAAGVPQLIMPMAHDQPDNAARCRRFGVGDYLYPGAFKPARIAGSLTRLLSCPAVSAACQVLREQMQAQMSEAQVAQRIETLSENALTGAVACRPLDLPSKP